MRRGCRPWRGRTGFQHQRLAVLVRPIPARSSPRAPAHSRRRRPRGSRAGRSGTARRRAAPWCGRVPAPRPARRDRCGGSCTSPMPTPCSMVTTAKSASGRAHAEPEFGQRHQVGVIVDGTGRPSRSRQRGSQRQRAVRQDRGPETMPARAVDKARHADAHRRQIGPRHAGLGATRSSSSLDRGQQSSVAAPLARAAFAPSASTVAGEIDDDRLCCPVRELHPGDVMRVGRTPSATAGGRARSSPSRGAETSSIRPASISSDVERGDRGRADAQFLGHLHPRESARPRGPVRTPAGAAGAAIRTAARSRADSPLVALCPLFIRTIASYFFCA